MKINDRQRIRVWYSTDLEDLGYGRNPRPEILTGEPDFVGTIRQVIEYRESTRRGIGTCYQRWQYQIVATGEYIPAREWDENIVLDYLYN